MYKTKPTRREAKTIPPEGGIFLCPEETIPHYIKLGILALDDERIKSEHAQELLDKQLRLGQDRRAGSMLSTYGKELEAYVQDRSAKPAERTLSAEIVRSVETIEYLFDQACVYQGIRDAIRGTADRVATEIVAQLALGQSAAIGGHHYSRERGPFNYEFLCRNNGEDKPQTLFSWAGDYDDATFVQAQFSDQITLLQDVMILTSE